LLLNFKLAESQSKVCKTSKAHTLEHSARNLHAQKYAINWGAFYDAHRLQQGSKKKGSKVGEKWGLKHQPQLPFPAKENEKERLRAIIYSPNCFRGKLLNLAFRTELNHASAHIALNDLMISPIKFTPFVIKL